MNCAISVCGVSWIKVNYVCLHYMVIGYWKCTEIKGALCCTWGSCLLRPHNFSVALKGETQGSYLFHVEQDGFLKKNTVNRFSLLFFPSRKWQQPRVKFCRNTVELLLL